MAASALEVGCKDLDTGQVRDSVAVEAGRIPMVDTAGRSLGWDRRENTCLGSRSSGAAYSGNSHKAVADVGRLQYGEAACWAGAGRLLGSVSHACMAILVASALETVGSCL